MVGSAILRRLATCGCDMITAGRDEVGPERQDQAEGFLTKSRPDVVIVAGPLDKCADAAVAAGRARAGFALAEAPVYLGGLNQP
jgi:dTDP-4-dehydrorhamnose reductase